MKLTFNLEECFKAEHLTRKQKIEVMNAVVSINTYFKTKDFGLMVSPFAGRSTYLTITLNNVEIDHE